MEPISVLTIGDPHFKVSNVPETDEMVANLLMVAEKTKPTIIVCLGDILHCHEKIHVTPLMRAERMIQSLSKIAPTFLLIGNHDRPNNSDFLTDRHAFNSLKQWPNIYIVDTTMDANIKGYRFVFVPYVPPGQFLEALNTIDNPLVGTTAIFAHQEFYQAKMGAILSKAGDKWDLNYPLVISGHVHDYDKLQSNLIYVGTPLQHAFGDHSDKKISLFTFQENTWDEERIDLGLTKRLIVYITPDDIHTYEPPPNSLVKLVIQGDKGSLSAVSKLDKYKQLEEAGVSIKLKPTKSNTVKNGPILRLNYKDRLYTKVQNNEGVLKWFKSIF